MEHSCPSCTVESDKVIYLGLPMKYCHVCGIIWGAWSIFAVFNFNAKMLCYTGSFYKAFLKWLLGKRTH